MKFSDLKGFRARHAGLIVAGLVTAVLFFAIGAGIRLLTGPVSLRPFSDRLQTALARALPGVAVRFDSAALEWSRDEGRVDLVVLGARVLDSRGRIIAQAPKADIGLVPSALVRGDIVVNRIALVGVQMTLVRTREGVLRMGVSSDKEQPDLLKLIQDAINSSGKSAPPLQSFAIRKARLAFYDEQSGLFIVAPKADLKMASHGKNTSVQLNADIEISGRRTYFAANLSIPAGGGQSQGNIDVKGLNLAALGSNAKVFSGLKPVDLTLDFTAHVKLAGSRLADVSFRASGHGGIAGWGTGGGLLNLGKLNAIGQYDANTGHYLVSQASLSGGQITGDVSAAGDLNYNPQDVLISATTAMQIRNVEINMPEEFSKATKVTKVALDGSYTPASKEAVLQRFSIDAPQLRGHAQGKLTFGSQSPAIELEAGADVLPVHAGIQYWPKTVVDGARDWIDRNISAGSVGPFKIHVNIPQGVLESSAFADGQLVISFPIKNATVTYIKGLTAASDVNGSAVLNGNTFTTSLSSGTIGPITLTKADAVIPNLDQHNTTGTFTAHLDGKMSDILALVDMPPLGYPTRFHIDPDDTKGIAALDVSVKVPMLKDLNVRDIGVSIDGNATGLDIAVGKSARISNGDIQFQITNDQLHASGTAAYATRKMALDWTELFDSTKEITTQITASMSLDQAARKAFGIDLGSIVSGAVPVTAKITGHRGTVRRANLSVDLTPAKIDLTMINLRKPAGVSAMADADLQFAQSGMIMSALVNVRGKDIQAQGTAQFDDTGTLSHVDFPRIRAGKSNDFSLSLTRGGNSSLDLAITGASLDGSAFASSGSKGHPEKEKFPGPFRISAHLAQLKLRDGVALTPFAMDAEGIEDRLSALSLTGNFAPHGPGLTAGLTTSSGSRVMTIKTANAGLLAKGFFGLTSIRDGKAELVVTFPRDVHDSTVADNEDDFSGTLTAEDFRVMHQPFLARLFSAGSLTGFVDLMGGQGIAIDKLTVPFTAKNGSLKIREARASGPAIGVSADGYIDRPRNEIALRGTMAPLYGINSILGVIPLVGNVLVSKKGEGVFGVTYSVSGNADEPKVSVNPLAMLTPGILRRIFEGRIPREKGVTGGHEQPSAPKRANPPSGSLPKAPASEPKKTGN